MARPVDHEQHAQMAFKAFEVIRAGRFGDLSMARLAKAMEVKRSTLYWYFPNLGDLFEVILAQVLERQSVAVFEEVAAAHHPIDQLTAWMRAVFRFHEADPDLLTNLIQLWAVSHPDRPQHAVATAVARYEPLRRAAIEMIDKGQRDGLVGHCESESLVDLCSAVLDGSLVHFVGRGVSPGRNIDHFTKLVLEPLRLGGGAHDHAHSTQTAAFTPTMDWLEED